MTNLQEIELRRDAANIPQKELCERAGIHPAHYSKLKLRKGPRGASETTLQKLKDALDELVEEKLKVLTGEGRAS